MTGRPNFLDDNPAGRLLDVLRCYVESASQHRLSKDLWTEVLGTTDDASLFRRLGYVHALPAEAEKAVRSLDDQHEQLWLRWMPAVTAALAVPLQTHSHQLVTNLGPTALSELEFTALELSRRVPEHNASATDTVNTLSVQIDDLAVAVADSDIADELAEFLTEHIAAMAAAVADYRIRGVAGVRSACESAFGAVVLRSRVNPPVTHEEKGLLRRLGEVAAASLLALSILNSSLELRENIIRALDPPPATATSADPTAGQP